MSLSKAVQLWNQILEIVEALYSLADIFHDVQRMLFESITLVKIWLVFEREKLQSFRSNRKHVLEEHDANFLKAHIYDLSPGALSQLNCFSHTGILSFHRS